MMSEPQLNQVRGPYDDYYNANYVASVEFVAGEMVIVGSKKALNKAKAKTNFCYVKDIANQKAVRLVLIKGKWVVAE